MVKLGEKTLGLRKSEVVVGTKVRVRFEGNARFGQTGEIKRIASRPGGRLQAYVQLDDGGHHLFSYNPSYLALIEDPPEGKILTFRELEQSGGLVSRLPVREVWGVASRTDDERAYLVLVWGDGRMTCDCPATVECWHIRKVHNEKERERGKADGKN